MNEHDSTHERRARLALRVVGFVALAGCTTLVLGLLTRREPAASEQAPVDEAPLAAIVPVEPPAELAHPAAEEPGPALDPRAALEEWVAGLAKELVHEPYQARVYQERLEGCLSCWTPELRAEFESWLQAPPASDPDFVVLASLGRALSLRLAPALATRLRPLAQREDLPFGVALESARALVAGGGNAELGWWCAALEGAQDARSRAIAAGALDAAHDGAAERFLIERALELADPRAAGRLLDALSRALEGMQEPGENPARRASAERLAFVSSDTSVDAGLRARALHVLRALDPEAASRVATEWFLDPAAGPERIEFAANSLHGQAAAGAALQAAQADARLDDARRVRLAECVLFSAPESLTPELREQGLSQMRTALRESGDRAARRRALHALARFGTDEDKLLVQQTADGDSDQLARAAARSALMRESSDWR